MLVEWLTDWASLLEDGVGGEAECHEAVARLCRRARVAARFAALWGGRHEAAALQLAAGERAGWPLPVRRRASIDVLADILCWEDRHRAAA